MTAYRLFIIDGIITMPIAIAGFFVLPDLPETTRAWYLSTDERKLCVDRMVVEGHALRQPYTKAKM
jgi:MFS transporter, ACS family, pantothenate transporter